jgi:hypothetical protein
LPEVGTVNRRVFLKFASTAVPLTCLRPSWAKSTALNIAVTFDDPTTEGGANPGWKEINVRIVGTLAKRKLRAVLFVCGKRVDTDAGRQLVSAWDSARAPVLNSKELTCIPLSVDARTNHLPRLGGAIFDFDSIISPMLTLSRLRENVLN